MRSWLLYLLMAAAVGMASRNLRSGTADLHGAAKLALFCLISLSIGRYAAAAHIFGDQELSNIWRILGVAASNAVPVFVIYLALEPWVRRSWPQTLIPWSRFTTKGIRDPLVGRDLVCGAAFGAVFTVLNLAAQGGQPWQPTLDPIGGVRPFLWFLGNVVTSSLVDPAQYLFLIFLCRVILRRQWAATAAFLVIMAVLIGGGAGDWRVGLPIGLAFAAFYAFVLLRFGFLALIATSICAHLMMALPRTLDFSLWFAPIGAAPLVIIAIIAIYGYRLTVSGNGTAVPQANTR
jgi:serine/threonine-protein kinase